MIRHQLARSCPEPMTDEELENAARFVEAHPDKESIAEISVLSKKDQEARICRGIK